MADVKFIEIADINFAINSDNSINLISYDLLYKPFLKEEKKDNNSDNIMIYLTLKEPPSVKKTTNLFNGKQSWSICRYGIDYCITYKSPYLKQPLWFALVKHNFKKVTIYCSKKLLDNKKGKITISNPLRYPLDQILLMYYLSDKKGMLIHAAGLEFNGEGFIFPGKSGAGKSTISRLFLNRANTNFLSDDRIIVRKINTTFKAFGTPWPGEAGIAVNKSTNLSGIFFISHANFNKIEEIKPKKALKNLLPVVSIPWYDKEIMTRILDFCGDLVSSVPIYEFQFKPDIKAVYVFEKFVTK